MGATVVTSSASAQPISAVSHRPNPAPGFGSRVITMIACTPAWVIIRFRAPSQVATDMARIVTTMICHTPVPNR